jgi:TfoX/Sxy family transcriptional regulator of competence genes
MSYWRVPLEVLEDPSELATWALAAIRAAGNAAAPKSKRKAKPRPAGESKRKRRLTPSRARSKA